MKKFLLTLSIFSLLFTSTSFADGPGPEITTYYSGFIDITVLSNIKSQLFEYNIKDLCISGTGESGSIKGYDSAGSRIIIPVKEFKCTNLFAYNDFLDLLNAGRFPYLEIDIPQSSSINYFTGDSVVMRNISITVAGVSKRYDINCKIDKIDNQNQVLDGKAKIRLTDLEIVPPVKLLGLVKVKNEIIINFRFCLKIPEVINARESDKRAF